MTWAEFQLRLFAYKRIEKRNQSNLREVAWASLIGFNVDPKKLPKTKEDFWHIYGKAKGGKATEIQKDAYLKAMYEYQKIIKRNERAIKG